MVAAPKSYAMFCAFCFHSKQPEEVFSNHWVKDKKDGTVTCPLLLKNECGYCHEKGHTPKFCPRLKSRDARRKVHAERFRNRPSQIRGMAKVEEQIREKEEAAARQKRARLACNDNQYAELIGTSKCAKSCCSVADHPKPAGPKPSAARALQGAWAVPAAAGILSADEQEFVNKLLSPQTMEETADGEAFFDNALDAEDTVERLHSEDTAMATAADAEAAAMIANGLGAPQHVRQLHFAAAGRGGSWGGPYHDGVIVGAIHCPFPLRPYPMDCQPDEEMRSPVPQAVLVKPGLRREYTTPGKEAFAKGKATREEAIAMDSAGFALPETCDLGADFGESGSDGWGSD